MSIWPVAVANTTLAFNREKEKKCSEVPQQMRTGRAHLALVLVESQRAPASGHAHPADVAAAATAAATDATANRAAAAAGATPARVEYGHRGLADIGK